MNFASDELKNDYSELLEELREIITNLKGSPADAYKRLSVVIQADKE